MSAYVGIDVSKAWLDVATNGDDAVRRFVNDRRGQRQLVKWLLALKPCQVLLEATGGYEQTVLDALHSSGLPVSRVNPRQARDFAKATGQLAKTDGLDARILAQMAAAVEVRRYEPRAAWQRELAELQHRRSQLLQIQVSEQQHLVRLEDVALRRMARHHLAWLKREVKGLEKRIEGCLRGHPELAPLGTIKGVGTLLQATLASQLPELGQLSGKAVAKLVGVAPFSHDSGQHSGRRHTWGGRGDIRVVLYMAALSAMKHDPALRAFYTGLRGRGKVAKVAIVAVMRKILVILNARMRDAMVTASVA